MNKIDKLEKLAKKHNIILTYKPNNHIQLQGKLLINYYPLSKNKTAYIACTKKSIKNVNYKQAVLLCNTLPKGKPVKRKQKSNRKIKLKLLNKHPFCKWCHCKLTEKTGTIDHVIPLSIGGLNNFNNYVLACKDCNQKRGNSMPELFDK